MTHHTSRRKSSVLIVGVFLVSSSLMAFEIAFTRLMSVMLSYHYVFAIVSLSIFGLGVGGFAVQLLQRHASDEPLLFDDFSLLTGLCSLTMALSVVITLRISHADIPGTGMLLYGGIFFVPFLFGGMFLAKVFRFFPLLGSRIYGADLVGAAAGCIGVVLALNVFSAASTLFFFATVTSLSSLLFSFAKEMSG